MTPSVFRSLRFRLIASVVVIEIVMLSLLVWSNIGLLQQAYADRLEAYVRQHPFEWFHFRALFSDDERV